MAEVEPAIEGLDGLSVVRIPPQLVAGTFAGASKRRQDTEEVLEGLVLF